MKRAKYETAILMILSMAMVMVFALMLFALMPSAAYAEDEAAGDAASEDVRDKVPLSIPRLILHINEGKAGIDAMNADEEHETRCTGTVDIIVPDDFAYSDADTYAGYEEGAQIESQMGLKLDYIRGRGNSTWGHDGKRPYKVKLDKKTSVLGMEKNKNWALIANAYDPSMMRNRLTYWLGRQLGMEFTPDACPVDVFIGSDEDGYEYYGSYLLTHIPKNYVDIDQPDADTSDEKSKSAGYLLSMMQDAGSSDVFVTKKNESFQNVDPIFSDPDDGDYGTDFQKKFIRDYVQEAEYALYEGEIKDPADSSGYRKLDYRDYFDLDAAALYWIMQAYTRNGDAYSTGSTYFYKQPESAGGKIVWGPLWDFDFAWAGEGMPDDETELESDMGWMYALAHDHTNGSMYYRILKTEWPRVEALLEEIAREGGILDQYYEETQVSQQADYELNGDKYEEHDVAENYYEAVEELREWINAENEWMNKKLYVEGALANLSRKVTLKADPDDEHPQVFYLRDGEFLYQNPEKPEKEGYYCLGWFVDDSDSPDYGKSIESVSVSKDISATAKYIPEDEVTYYTDLYFASDKVYAYIGNMYYDSQIIGFPEDALDKRFRWTSSDESVAEVDNEGYVTFHKTGTTYITAEVPKSGVAATYELIVTDTKVDPEGFAVPPVIEMKPGEVMQLEKLSPENAQAWYITVNRDDGTEDIAKVYDNGIVKALKPGEFNVQLSATYEGEDGDVVNLEQTVKIIVRGDEEPDQKPDGGGKVTPKPAQLLHLKSTQQTNSSITMTWHEVKGADKYVLYGNQCDKKGKKYAMKKLATYKSNVKSQKITKVLGKKVKKGTYYKLQIVALDKNNNVISKSRVVHVATKGGKYGNYKKVTVKSSVIKKAKSLKTGKSLKLKAKAVKGKKTVKKHAGIAYVSDNTKIATVSSKGVVKAKAKGTCYVYAYAQNGVAKKVKITVK